MDENFGLPFRLHHSQQPFHMRVSIKRSGAALVNGGLSAYDELECLLISVFVVDGIIIPNVV